MGWNLVKNVGACSRLSKWCRSHLAFGTVEAEFAEDARERRVEGGGISKRRDLVAGKEAQVSRCHSGRLDEKDTEHE
jgi:hypothetical protein